VMNALYGGNEEGARNMAFVTTVVGVLMLYLANRFLRRVNHRG